jgi:hypothetical protein
VNPRDDESNSLMVTNLVGTVFTLRIGDGVSSIPKVHTLLKGKAAKIALMAFGEEGVSGRIVSFIPNADDPEGPRLVFFKTSHGGRVAPGDQLLKDFQVNSFQWKFVLLRQILLLILFICVPVLF